MLTEQPQKALEALLAEHCLHYASASDLSVCRRRCGSGFIYLDASGKAVREKAQLLRFKGLAIPPAWERVRLAPEPAWHLQALGFDALGRTQRRYHDMWEEIRNADKLARLRRFAIALPRIRMQVERQLRKPLQDPDALCAAAVRLIDLAHLRPGSETALKQLGSRGATTLAPANVTTTRNDIRLAFRGKAGIWVEVTFEDALLSRKLARLKETNRRRLFRIDRDGYSQDLSCAALNAYLQRIAEAPVSSKDFRTHVATVLALWRLSAAPLPVSRAGSRRVLALVAREVADCLHNTAAVARKSYIHPAVIEAWLAGEFDNGKGSSLRRSARASRYRSAQESALHKFLLTR